MLENEAIKKLKEGSVEAFEELYNLYHGRLYNYMLKLTKGNTDTAAEIIQSVFVKLWDIRSDIDENKNLFNFLYAISKNLLLNAYSHLMVKQAYNKYVLNSKHSDASLYFTEQEVNKNLLDQLIIKLTDQMPSVRKKIFIMSRREGKSHKEISQALGISEKTVENQIGKALSFLRNGLTRYYGDESFSE